MVLVINAIKSVFQGSLRGRSMFVPCFLAYERMDAIEEAR